MEKAKKNAKDVNAVRSPKESVIQEMENCNLDGTQLNNHFLNLAKIDALNSMRTTDTIKERLTTALLAKVDQMDAEQLLKCIDAIDGSKIVSSYKALSGLINDA